VNYNISMQARAFFILYFTLPTENIALLGARLDIFEWFLHMDNLQLEIKWLKGIYLIDRTIKVFESQGKSAGCI